MGAGGGRRNAQALCVTDLGTQVEKVEGPVGGGDVDDEWVCARGPVSAIGRGAGNTAAVLRSPDSGLPLARKMLNTAASSRALAPRPYTVSNAGEMGE